MSKEDRDRRRREHQFRAWLLTNGLYIGENVGLFQPSSQVTMVPAEAAFRLYVRQFPDADRTFVDTQLELAKRSYPGLRVLVGSPLTQASSSGSDVFLTTHDSIIVSDSVNLAVTGAVADTEPETEIWTPSTTPLPPAAMLRTAPGCLLLAADLLRSGKSLHELPNFRDLEELVAYLLQHDGWDVDLTEPSNDGGIDVFATKLDHECGPIQTIWQAKMYKPTHKVGISTIRELAHVRDEVSASKAFLLTTSFLTDGALTKIRRDQYRLGAQEKPDVEAWVRRALGE